MSEHLYTPGAWFAAVGPRAAVLISDELPAPALDALWDAVSDNAVSAGEVLRCLDAVAYDDLAYAVGVVDGERVWIIVRSGATAVVTDATGRERIIDNGGLRTQVEYAARDVTMLRLGREGRATGGPELPIVAGIVTADSLEWNPPGPEHREVDAPDTIAVRIPMHAVDAPAYPDEPDAPADGQTHDGHTIARSELEVLRSAASAQASTAAATVQAIVCSQNHASPPESLQCRVCGEPLDENEPVTLARPALGQLRFSTGQVVDLDRRVVVGRAPTVDRVSADDLPQLVQVDSPEQDVSRSHAEVRLEGWQVLVVDLDSINGTIVTTPGRPPERLNALEPYPLAPGAIVDLAGEVTFRYEAVR